MKFLSFLVGITFIFSGCQNSGDEIGKLIIIDSLRQVNENGIITYKPLDFTNRSFALGSGNNETIRIEFQYKNKLAADGLFLNYADHILKFKRVGAESDYIIRAMCELYDESPDSGLMKKSVEFNTEDWSSDTYVLDGLEKTIIINMGNKESDGDSLKMMLRMDWEKTELSGVISGRAEKAFIRALMQ